MERREIITAVAEPPHPLDHDDEISSTDRALLWAGLNTYLERDDES